ncbi:MAG: right-handed parallel beta-helix repeat-containing protein [Alphaproteobacteria bacterium]|nr:right-handed parallel beta-helix repeat-containing protein [Alphaproteobacteria bacterium]
MIRALILLASTLLIALSPAVQATDILIADDDFNKFLSKAKPGDIFSIYPGRYKVTRTIKLAANGTKEAPITIRPSKAGKVVIEVDTQIGFKISGKNWIVEDLDFVGICVTHSTCEHAMQIVGNADGAIIRNNSMVDFNSAIKGNGDLTDNRQYFPDHVLIEKNKIYNRTPRQTRTPVTPIDVVGGRFWTIRENFIADFQKLEGNQISMAGFLKGNSDNGLIEKNLVICEWKHKGGIRLGLSLGGGGTTNPQFCQGRSCKIEHYKGTIRSNVIMNCPADVGLYLNDAANTTVVNNTIINTLGIDVRFNGSFATIANNIVHGRIKERDGGRYRGYNNIVEEDLADIFPRAAFNDFTPKDMSSLKDAAFGFEGIDFCTGKPQEDWVGAFAYPMACSIADFLPSP